MHSTPQARFEIAVFATFTVLHLPGAVVAVSHLGPPATATAAAALAAISVVTSCALWLSLTAAALHAAHHRHQIARTPLTIAFALDTTVLTISGLSPPRPGNITAAAIGILAICSAAALLTRPQLLPMVILPAIVGQTKLLWAADAEASTSRLIADVLTVTAVSVATTALITWLERERRRSQAALLTAAHNDPLTGLLNRRGLSEGLPTLQHRHSTQRHPRRPRRRTHDRDTTPAPGTASPPAQVIVIVFDIDRFKNINDRRGHDVGDAVLVSVAHTMRDCSRADDLLVRLGGEELAWIGVWPSIHEAVIGAERLRALVNERTSALGEPITISAGISRALQLSNAAVPLPATAAAEALSQALTRADGALYRAKNAGRDRIALAADNDVGPQPNAP